MENANFKVYYSSGSTHMGNDPYITPVPEVVAIVQIDNLHGRRVVAGDDFYVWKDTSWYGTDLIGMFQYLMNDGPRRVLYGVMVHEEQWQSIMRLANNDSDFPKRTAYGRGERRV